MSGYEKFMVFLAGWTLLEGTWVVAAPRSAGALARKLFPKAGAFLQEMPTQDLRKLGAVELVFGVLLSMYLLWRV